MKKKSLKRIIIGFLMAALVVTDTIMWAAYLSKLTPYAISSDGEVICYVSSKDTAKDVMDKIYSNLAEDGSEISAISSDIHIEKADGQHKTVTADQASKIVLEAASDKDTEIRIVSTKTETKAFMPDPVYERNDTMIAGQSAVVSEGAEGVRTVTVSYTTVNGKTKETKEVVREVISEGTPAVIEKGTLGLPDGEQWQYYEGYPVCRDGGDIITTARSYVGKVPYVWGGKDLTKGVDCSGFVIAVYRLYGVSLSYPLYKEGVGVPYQDAQPGDILYFPGHYGLYIGNGMMVHASNKRTGVIVSSVGNRKILAVRRIVTD
jgi:cell wall-associated NlpC family hydrolase